MPRNNEDFHVGIQGMPPSDTAPNILGSAALGDHEDLMGRFDFAQGDDSKLLRHKYNNAVTNGLKDELLKNGVQQPVEVHIDKYGDKTVTEGHHRLAVMAKHRPKSQVPIKYWRG